jgi:hypothetical protein
MNLYIVISSWDYEGGTIRGVFTSKARAKELLETFPTGAGTGYDWHHIVKVKANDANISIGIPTEDETEV